MVDGQAIGTILDGTPPPPPPPPPASAATAASTATSASTRHRRLPHRRRAVRCVVPRVIGMTLSRARTRIRARHCSVGRIRRARSRRVGRVVGQSPRPGARRARGARVNLVVGRR